MKNTSDKKTRIPWAVIAIVLLAIISIIIATVSQMKSSQADESIVPSVKFIGEYRIEGEEWKPISDKHISATDGIVELKGFFLLYDEETGEAHIFIRMRKHKARKLQKRAEWHPCVSCIR